MGFEVIVRPAVFPNIRPAPPRVLAPSGNDPMQGLAVLSGGGGKFVGTSVSWSASFSSSTPHKETKRQFNKERVHQVDENGKINKSNFVEVERLKKVMVNTPEGPIKQIYADPPKVANVETIETNVERSDPTA